MPALFGTLLVKRLNDRNILEPERIRNDKLKMMCLQKHTKSNSKYIMNKYVCANTVENSQNYVK